MDDPVGRVRVQPVEATPIADERALGRVLHLAAADPDPVRDLARDALDEDRQMGMDMEQQLLGAQALDAVDRSTAGTRGRSARTNSAQEGEQGQAG